MLLWLHFANKLFITKMFLISAYKTFLISIYKSAQNL